MSLTTGTQKSTIPISTFTITSDGVVQTGTVASISVSVFTGVPITATTTGPDTVLFTTTINGTPSTGASLIMDTRTQTGTGLPIRAISIVTVTLPLSTQFATSQLTTTTESLTSSQPVETTTNSFPLKTVTTSLPVKTATITSLTTPGVLPSTSASSIGSVLTNTQPSTTSSSSMPATSTSRVPTTLMTSTTSTSPSSHPTATPIPAMPPVHMNNLWWVPIPAILGVLAVIALLLLWRKRARKSFDRAGCFIHAVFETIGGIIFGKRWDKWKATREENRRKKAEVKNRLSPLDDRHIRNILLNRWNETVESHRKQGTMPEHNSPPSTASGGTWRNLDRDTLLRSPRPEPVEMTDLGTRTRPASNSDDVYSDSSQGVRRKKRKGKSREVPSSLSRSSRTVPDQLKSVAPQTNIASPMPFLNEGRLNALALWPETWPEAPHPGIPWEPKDTESLVSHNQWFPQEVSSAELRTQIQKDVEAKRQSILRNLDTQSNASFRGARGVWPVIHPQPLPPPAKTPPLAAAVILPSTTLPPPSLPADHPILRIPSSKPLPGESKRSFNQLHLPPLQIGRPIDSQWTHAIAPGTECGPSSKEDTLQRSRNGATTSFLGSKKPSPRKEMQTTSAPKTTPFGPPQPPTNTPLPPPPPIPETVFPDRSQTATRRTSISEWTDATVPATERASSRTPPLQIERWATAIATRGLAPSATANSGDDRRRHNVSSVASWENPGTASVAGTDHAPSPQRFASRDRDQEPRVPGWNTARQSVTSAYSGYWEDEAGGRIEYDRHGRIRDVEFQGGVRVLLASEGEEPRSRSGFDVDVEKGRGRERVRHGDGSEVGLDNKGYQRDVRGRWI